MHPSPSRVLHQQPGLQEATDEMDLKQDEREEAHDQVDMPPGLCMMRDLVLLMGGGGDG